MQPWRTLPFARQSVVAVGALGVAVYMMGLASGSATLCLAAKPIPVLCLVFWSATRAGRYARLVTLGLAISMIADVAIEWTFLGGLGLFLLAHIVYLAAFLSGRPPLRLLRALPVLAVLAAAYSVIAPGLGSLQKPVIAYMFAVGAMVWRASARVGQHAAPRSAELSALAGAVCFAASDTLLALDRFHSPIQGASYGIMLLYWTGQFGIARSASADRG